MSFFTQDQLKAIADALGDTEAGLTGTEIQHLFATCNLNDPGPITKRVRIFNAFAKSQNDKQHRTHILEFVRQALKPAQYSRKPERYEPMRALVNPALAFAGLVEIGRASCRERGCPYVQISVDDVALQKKTTDTTTNLR